MTDRDTGAPTDVRGGMPVTEEAVIATPAAIAADDALAGFDDERRQAFAAIAERLIPEAHGMPSAASVVNDQRLRFVFRARPDLVDPFLEALRPELGSDIQARLDTLARDEHTDLAALQLVLVGAYYTDRQVRDLIGYPGQMAIEVRSWEVPPYLEEGLIDAVMARGQVWRDPATGRRAETDGIPQTYAERYWPTERRPEGGTDGDDGS